MEPWTTEASPSCQLAPEALSPRGQDDASYRMRGNRVFANTHEMIISKNRVQAKRRAQKNGPPFDGKPSANSLV